MQSIADVAYESLLTPESMDIQKCYELQPVRLTIQTSMLSLYNL